MNKDLSLRSAMEVVDEVSRIVNVENPYDLVESVIESIKQVYRDIKIKEIGMPQVAEFLVKGNTVILPAETLHIIDVAIGGISLRENVAKDGRIHGRSSTIRYRAWGNRIVLDGSSPQKVTVTFWQIPTDETGEAMVGDELFMATVYHVAQKEALVQSRRNGAMVGIYREIKQNYNSAIDSARGNMTAASWGEMLDLFASIRLNFFSGYDL